MIPVGHGGNDNGATRGFAEEDDINLSVSYLLRCLLQQEGFSVLMTREKDMSVDLQQRCVFANGINAHLFVSIHCDAWHNKTVKGISTHIYTRASAVSTDVARKIHQSLLGRFPDHANRGIKKSNFYVLRNTKMPAVLIECEFVSNPDMRKFLKEPENQFAIASSIMNGIKNV